VIRKAYWSAGVPNRDSPVKPCTSGGAGHARASPPDKIEADADIYLTLLARSSLRELASYS